MRWEDCSEIVTGLALKNRIAVNAVRTETVMPPYSDIIKMLKIGSCHEDIIEQIGLNPYQVALEAEHSVNGSGDRDWIKMLESSYELYRTGQMLEKTAKKMQSGETPDISNVRYELSKFDGGKTGRKRLSDIESQEIPFVKTGWPPIDDHLGGLPEVGLVVVAGNPGVGKAQPFYSKILTPTGWTTMGEISVDDMVIGFDGKAHKVLGVFPQGIRPIYRVWFDDDTYADCDEEHLWLTQSRTERFYNKNATLKTTKDILDSVKVEKGKRKNHSIEIVNPIDFYKQDILLHPYYMGILLSEGGFRGNSPIISSGDKEVIEKIQLVIPDEDKMVWIANFGFRITKKNKEWHIPSLTQSALRYYELTELKSEDKFIPKEYLYNSLENRIELLRGLLDGDGSVIKRSGNTNNFVEYSTSSEQLKNNVIDLCRSLGAKVGWSSREGRYTKNGIATKTQINYRIFISFSGEFNPFYLPRKAKLFTGKKKYHKRFIEKIEFLGNQETKCIYIASQDHLYITDNYIVTHNTSFMAKLVTRFAKQHPDKKVAVYSLEMILEEISKRFREIEKSMADVEDRIEINADPMTTDEIVADAARIDDLGLVVIDFADYLVRGEITESSMGMIYRTLSIGSKLLSCPIVLLSQLNRTYGGGVPRPRHIRYTSLAEILAWMLLMLYNPETDFYEDNEKDREVLPVMENTAYIIAWKVRGGFTHHKDDSPGAIATGFKGEKGWYTDKSRWFSLKKVV